MSARTWSDTGAGAVNATADIVGGMFGAFKGLGKRINRSRFDAFIEGFSAVVGDILRRNGEIKPDEIQALRDFLLQNHEVPAIQAYGVDDIIKKVKDYAVAAFLGEKEKMMVAIKPLIGKDDANLALIGALCVAYSDGGCDKNEQQGLSENAQILQVDLYSLAHGAGFNLPRFDISLPGCNTTPRTLPTPTSTTSIAQNTQSAVGRKVCPMCGGQPGKVENCLFCNKTGFK